MRPHHSSKPLPSDTRAVSLRNQLLAALPSDDFQRLRPTLDVVSPDVNEILHRAGERIEHVYFPCAGFCAELTVLPSGEMVELATVWCEGMVGVFGIEKDARALSVSMVQAAMDTCYRLFAAAFCREMDARGSLYDEITRFWARARAVPDSRGRATRPIGSSNGSPAGCSSRTTTWALTRFR